MSHKIWIGLMAIMIAAVAAPATPTEVVLYNFCALANCADGSGPMAGMVADASGNLYGTTNYGGSQDAGTVFELKRSGSGWIPRLLHSFCSAPNCADGEQPQGLAFDSAGNLYGMASDTKTYGPGTVFELTSSGDTWIFHVIYRFHGGAYGSIPVGSPAFDASGNLYGVASAGGIGDGIVFELTPSNGRWTETLLYAFGGQGLSDGSEPSSGVILDAEGNIYGATPYGGTGAFCTQPTGCGVVYELQPAYGGWEESILYAFCSVPNCTDGFIPAGGLTFDSTGDLYGAAAAGGNNANCDYSCGAVFELIPSNGGWAESVLYSFGDSRKDGYEPSSGIVFDSFGNLYGTTSSSRGNSDDGTVYQLSLSGGAWAAKFFSFADSGGADPSGTPVISKNKLFGTTQRGGTYSDGVVYEIKPY